MIIKIPFSKYDLEIVKPTHKSKLEKLRYSNPTQYIIEKLDEVETKIENISKSLKCKDE